MESTLSHDLRNVLSKAAMILEVDRNRQAKAGNEDALAISVLALVRSALSDLPAAAPPNEDGLSDAGEPWGEALNCQTFATAAEIDKARTSVYSSENIVVDDGAKASHYSGGFWVQAWFRVEDDE